MTAKLIYVAMQSLDGYIEDPKGKFDWARPDDEVHQFVNDLVRPVGTYLYGRRMYRAFDVDAVGEMKARAQQDLAIGGPGLAAHAFRACLIEEIHLFVAPRIVGGGKQALPEGVCLELKLVDERRFDRSGVVYLRYVAG